MRQDDTYEPRQLHHVTGRPEYAADLRVTDATYCPAGSAEPAQVHVEFDVHRDRNPANAERLNAANERLDGGSHHVDSSIDAVATERLQERTGTTAHIIDGGYTIGVTTDVPAAIGNRQALTAAQETQLPALVQAIKACLPNHEQHNAHDLAAAVARQIPTKSAVIESVDQITLREIIDHHDRKMAAYAQELLRDHPDAAAEAADLQPALQAFSAVRLIQRSFPQHPSAALTPGRHATPTAASPTPTAHQSGPSIDR